MRHLLLIVVLAALACSLLTPATPPPSVAPTETLPVPATPASPTPAASTPTAGAAPAYLGQFDCYGTEGGLGAYAGRITLQPGGAVTLKDYDGVVTAGAWTYDAAANTFTFSGAIALASASYAPATDTLAVTLAASAALGHAEGGSMQCQRAKPGITGPP